MSGALGPHMMIVEELGQLLAEAFVALAFVPEDHGPFEQGMLKRLRQFAPEVGSRRAKDEKVTFRVHLAGHLVQAAARECRRDAPAAFPDRMNFCCGPDTASRTTEWGPGSVSNHAVVDRQSSLGAEVCHDDAATAC